MRRQRKLRKEDIGDPSNFVHVEGYGRKPSSVIAQQSTDSSDQENFHNEGRQGALDIPENGEESFDDGTLKVERRVKGLRSSLIPRHHRSTTTCIFPENGGDSGPYSHQHHHHHHAKLANQMSMDISSKRGSDSPSVSSLKPTFGSLLNLSFLPLGLGKSSSKSPSINTNKSKRASLLNLTAANLFSGPKNNLEGNLDSVHMTSYVRRRSFSNSDENGDTLGRNKKVNPVPLKEATPKVPVSSRIPLAKLGRSKSTMSEFNKRPKLRLKILPPPPPVPVPTVRRPSVKNDSEELPSPPPTPLPSPPPSPPKTPQSAPPVEDVAVVVKRMPKSPPRSRIIPLPSSCTVESLGYSPQYLTPAGGSSPLPVNNEDESAFPLTSPTIPPTSTPFFATPQHVDTPPVWPLQPTWPSTLAIPQIQPTIPEIPSPEKEEMEVNDSEYDPVLSIVESFITESQGQETQSSNTNAESDFTQESMEVPKNDSVSSANIEEISAKLQRSILFQNWPKAAKTLFESIPSTSTASGENDGEDGSKRITATTARANEIYGCIVSKTLEFWVEMMGDHATVDTLAKILEDAEVGDSAESVRNLLQSDEEKV